MDKIPADYWLILYCLLTPAPAHQRLSADVSLMNFFFRHFHKEADRLLVTGAGSLIPDIGSDARLWPQAAVALLLECLSGSYGSPDITHQFRCVIGGSRLKNQIEHPDQLARHRNHRLHLLQRIFLPCRVVLMDRPEFRIMTHHADRSFIQYISQPLPTAIADVAFTFVLTGFVLHNGVSGQLLQLFGIIETRNVPDFRYKPDHRFQSYTSDL